MEQILTIEQEKLFVAEYFKKAFQISDGELDEFTGERSFAGTTLYGFIKFESEDKFFDTDFKKISSQAAQEDYESTFSIKSESFQLQEMTKGGALNPHPDYSMAIQRAKDYALDDATERYRAKSHLDCTLYLKFGTEKSEPEFSIKLSFYNHSHNRNLKNIRFLILTVDGTRQEIPLANAEIIHKDDDDQYGGFMGFCDSVGTTIEPRVARMLTSKGTKVSVRFDSLTINGVVDDIKSEPMNEDTKTFMEKLSYGVQSYDTSVSVKIDMFVDMAFLYHECLIGSTTTIFTEEQIDEMYDYCTKAQEAYRKEQDKAKKNAEKEKQEIEKKKKEKETTTLLSNLEKNIAQEVNPYEFETLKKLFTTPQKIKSIAKLKTECEKTGMQSRNSQWIFSIGENYDKKTILADVKNCKEQLSKKVERKNALGALLLILGIGGVIYGAVSDADGALAAVEGITCAVLLVVGWRVLRKQPQVFFNETTMSFIKEWEQHFKKE